MKKRFRHTLVFNTLRPFFRFFIFLKFSYRAKRFKAPKGVKGPYLIISNHAMAIDPLLVSLSFKGPIFFIASDMIFSIPYVSPIIKYLVQPIPKTKYRSDIETVKDTMKMVKSGGSIGLFPEGNATFHGELMEIPFAVSKLIKLLKIPVLFYQISGGYQKKPRWARKIRKGKMTGEVTKLLHPDEYKEMKPAEIYKIILENLTTNNFKTQQIKQLKYRSRQRAMDIESAYFICPECKAMHTLTSEGNIVRCSACQFEAEYTEEGFMKPLNNTKYFENTHQWYLFQETELKKHLDSIDHDTLIFEDKDEKILKVLRARNKINLGQATLQLYKNRLEIIFEETKEIWPIEYLQSAAQQKNKLIIYHKKEEKTYYFVSHPKRNALKYVLAIEYLTKKEAT